MTPISCAPETEGWQVVRARHQRLKRTHRLIIAGAWAIVGLSWAALVGSVLLGETYPF